MTQGLEPTGSASMTARNRRLRLLSIVDGASIVFSWGAGLALVLLAGSVCIDVIGRAFFSSPLTGTLEMTANWWMPMLTLLAFGVTELRQEHIKVTILLDALSLGTRRIVEGLFGIVATALLLALAWYSLKEALDSAAFGETTASTPPVAIWPFKFVAAAGVAMLAFQSAATALRYFAGELPRPQVYDTDADIA